MTLKIGLVGAGRMVQLAHLPSLLQISGVEIVGVADVNSAAAESLAAAYNIPHVYETSQALVAGEPKLDGVVIVTPRMYHTETCLPVLERGIPVFMEKPLEATPEQGRVIVDAQQRSGAIMVIGYNNRYCPAYLTADAMLRSGELGETRYAHIHSFGGLWRAGAMMLDEISLEADPLPPDAPPKGQSRDGKTFPPELEWVEGWIHEINMARGLFGEAQSVLYASNDVPRLALVQFERARAFFEVGLVNPPGMPFDCTIAVFCRDGRLDLNFAAPMLLRQPTELKISTPNGVRIPLLEYRESFVEEMVHFLRCITGREQPRTTAQDALADLELCFEIVRAGRR